MYFNSIECVRSFSCTRGNLWNEWFELNPSFKTVVTTESYVSSVYRSVLDSFKILQGVPM